MTPSSVSAADEADRPFCRTYKAVEVLRTMFKEQLTVPDCTQNAVHKTHTSM
jgi:hypothetical protein